jgi:hypothetical protein
MPTLYIHIIGEEAFVGDVDELPEPNAQFILVKNPRTRDNKDLRNLLEEVQMVLLPWSRVNYIEVMPTGGEEEEVLLPFQD